MRGRSLAITQRQALCAIPQRSIPGQYRLTITSVTWTLNRCTLNTFTDDTKIGGVPYTPEGCAVRFSRTLTTSGSPAKGNTKSSPGEERLHTSVQEALQRRTSGSWVNASQQRASAASPAALGTPPRSREATLLLSSALPRHAQSTGSRPGLPGPRQTRTHWSQGTKATEGLQHLTHKGRLWEPRPRKPAEEDWGWGRHLISGYKSLTGSRGGEQV